MMKARTHALTHGRTDGRTDGQTYIDTHIHTQCLYFRCVKQFQYILPKMISSRCRPLLREACLGSRIRSVKVSTLSLSLLANVLSRDRDLIVVHVVRDPRSLMAVRNIPTPMLRIILPVTCDRMRQDIRTYNAVTRRHPRRLIQVRYEDLVAEPNKRAVRFVDLPCDFDNIDLLTLYAAKAGESRNSSASSLIERWHRSVPMGDIKKSLMDCHDVLVHYGYDIEV